MAIKTTPIQLETEKVIEWEQHPTTFSNPEFEHKLLTLISTFGQIIPVHIIRIDDEKYRIISGRRIFRTCKTLGLPMLRCMLIEGATKHQEWLLNVSLNCLTFDIDWVQVSRLMQEILLEMPENEQRHYLPFDTLTLDKLRAVASFDWESMNQSNNPAQLSFFDNPEGGASE